jgi:hypothetical protein
MINLIIYFSFFASTKSSSFRRQGEANNYFIEKCSAIGPKVKAGKNDNAAIITITANTMIPKVAVSVLSVPADSGMNFLLASIPAIATGPMIGKNRARKITNPVLTFQKILLAVNPA